MHYNGTVACQLRLLPTYHCTLPIASHWAACLTTLPGDKMSSLLQNLCKLSNTLLTNLKLSSNETFDEAFSRLVSLFRQITLKDLHLQLKDLAIVETTKTGPFAFYAPAPVSYVSIFENEIFSLTVFGLRRRSSRIPLHDHPLMYGFVKCVHGSVSVKSYSILEKKNDLQVPIQIRDRVARLGYNNIIPALYLGEEILSSENSQICSLTPFERNLHEIVPISNQMAVIADIISPPYTSQTQSYFYRIIDTIYDSSLNQSITWLFRSSESNEFYCDTIPYTGPRITI